MSVERRCPKYGLGYDEDLCAGCDCGAAEAFDAPLSEAELAILRAARRG